MRGPCESNSPFGGHFSPFAGMGRPPFGCPFRGDSPDDDDRKPAFGHFGRPRFDHSPERHCHREPERPKWGPFEHFQRRCSRRGASKCPCCGPHSCGRRQERDCHSPGTDIPHPWFGRNADSPWFGRNADQYCCGRRGQSGCSECHCRRTYEEHRGPRQISECCHHASTKPCCNQRRSCHDNCCDRRSRKTHCENCCQSVPSCGENKEDCERDDSLERTDREPVNERENKIQLVVLWLLREFLWKTLKGHHYTDAHMGTIITSTKDLQRSLELETDIRPDTNKTGPSTELD